MWICSPHLYCSDPLLLLSLISCTLLLPFRQQMSNKTIDEWNIPISSNYFDSTSMFLPKYELIYKTARGVMSWSCSYSCCRVSSVFSSGSAVTHWSAGGNINQCGEQSAPSLIQSPLQQNAAIRTTEACKCVFVCLCAVVSVWFVRMLVPTPATQLPPHRQPETNPFIEGRRSGSRPLWRWLLSKIGDATFLQSTIETEDQMWGQRDNSVVVVVIFCRGSWDWDKEVLWSKKVFSLSFIAGSKDGSRVKYMASGL